MWAEDLIITLNRKRAAPSKPYHRQVFEQVRNAILGGRLRSGDRLPATRELAATLKLARNTVARAYEDLLAEGYLEGRVGSGTYVSSELRKLPPGPLDGGSRERGPRHPFVKATSSARIVGQDLPHTVRTTGYLPFDFRPGIPDWDAFPRALWLRLIGRALRGNAAELGRYGEPGGYFPLREAIARHLAVSRGVVASAEQVVIVSGSQQALDLIARLCVRPSDSVALEDPGYPEAQRVLAGSASRQLFIPVDDEGIDVGALARMTRTRTPPRVVYVTPSHQFPTGATLPLSRRLALLDWAARRDVLIIEDDYDSEFRSPGRMIESLQGLDRAHKVIYIGTFSTVLFPPLRVGYVVLPPDMVEPFVQAKWLADRQTPTLEQLALTDFLEEGHFERHLRRMRRLVSARRDALRAAIEVHLSDWIELSRPSAGMHLMMWLSAPHPGASVAEMESRVVAGAASQGVGIYPVGPCYHGPPKEPTFLLGYAALTEQRIQEGIGILAKEISLLYKRLGRIR